MARILMDIERVHRALQSITVERPEMRQFADWWLDTERIRDAVRLSLTRLAIFEDNPLVLSAVTGDLEYIVEKYYLTPAMRHLSEFRRCPSLLADHAPVDFEA